jgi:hypothetical protein
MDQPRHHRRDNTAMFHLLMVVACIASLASFVQWSLHYQTTNQSTLSTTVITTVSLLKPTGVESQTKKSRDSSTKSVVVPDRRVLPRANITNRHPGSKIDSSNSTFLPQTTTTKLDFIIAGFPKTGTTSLLHAFEDHPETDIASKERCSITNPMTADFVAYEKLQETLSELSASPHVKRGIKCPNAVYHAYSTIARLEENAPPKVILGLRHPVEMIQSYYNYRVTEMYDQRNKRSGQEKKKQGKIKSIPPLDSLLGFQKEWKGVSTDSTRYELFLMQFGKTKVEDKDAEAMRHHGFNPLELTNHHPVVKSNRFTIFLYTLDQLEDTGNKQRSQLFRKGLQDYLGLHRPLKPVRRENLNHFVGKKAHPETVNICLPKYKSLRHVLVQQGTRSARWIEFEFLRSTDVVVANRGHFLESVQSWAVDPCDRQSNEVTASLTVDERSRRDLALARPRKRVFVGKNRKIELIPVK